MKTRGNLMQKFNGKIAFKQMTCSLIKQQIEARFTYPIKILPGLNKINVIFSIIKKKK